MWRVVRVQRSGFYTWLKKPLSNRAIDDQRLARQTRKLFISSGGTYGSRWIHRDLKELGQGCRVHRVARLMRINGMRAQIGYKRRWIRSGQPARVAPNRLNPEFSVEAPNQTWVGDFTYIRTYEGFLYLAVVLDLFSRRVVGWSMQPTMSRDLVMQALLSVLWRRRPTGTVLVHSDQGSQYGSQDYLAFLAEHNLEPSMSRRGALLHGSGRRWNSPFPKR